MVTFLATITGGILALKYRRHIGILAAFTAGILIGLAIFELFPEILTLSLEIAAPIESALVTVALGFIFLYLIDRHLAQPRKLERNHKKLKRPSLGLLVTAEFCSHALIEGMAIGFSFQFDWQLGVLVSVAVISHDFCDGLTAVTLMISAGNTLKASIGMLLVEAVAPIVGAAITLIFNLQFHYLILFLSFIAGAFIYIGSGNLLPLAFQEKPKYYTIVLLVFGIILIFILARLIG